jgi:hypothetical protein
VCSIGKNLFGNERVLHWSRLIFKSGIVRFKNPISSLIHCETSGSHGDKCEDEI